MCRGIFWHKKFIFKALRDIKTKQITTKMYQYFFNISYFLSYSYVIKFFPSNIPIFYHSVVGKYPEIFFKAQTPPPLSTITCDICWENKTSEMKMVKQIQFLIKQTNKQKKSLFMFKHEDLIL